MVAEGIDVWKVAEEGRVDFRISKDQFKEMQKTLPQCRESGSVEEIVKRAERNAAKRVTNATQDDWFERYVSCVM